MQSGKGGKTNKSIKLMFCRNNINNTRTSVANDKQNIFEKKNKNMVFLGKNIMNRVGRFDSLH